MDFPKVATVYVRIELADGRMREVVSRPGAINQTEGVTVNEDIRVDNDVMYQSGVEVDMVKSTTVSWTEQWTETTR